MVSYPIFEGKKELTSVENDGDAKAFASIVGNNKEVFGEIAKSDFTH